MGLPWYNELVERVAAVRSKWRLIGDQGAPLPKTNLLDRKDRIHII
jgi:hypothetical protein